MYQAFLIQNVQTMSNSSARNYRCAKRCMMNEECSGVNFDWITTREEGQKNGYCHLLEFDGDEIFVPSPDPLRNNSRILCDPECNEVVVGTLITGGTTLDTFLVEDFDECEAACNAQSATCNAAQVSELGSSLSNSPPSLRCFLLDLEAGLYQLTDVPNYTSKRFCKRARPPNTASGGASFSL